MALLMNTGSRPLTAAELEKLQSFPPSSIPGYLHPTSEVIHEQNEDDYDIHYSNDNNNVGKQIDCDSGLVVFDDAAKKLYEHDDDFEFAATTASKLVTLISEPSFTDVVTKQAELYDIVVPPSLPLPLPQQQEATSPLSYAAHETVQVCTSSSAPSIWAAGSTRSIAPLVLIPGELPLSPSFRPSSPTPSTTSFADVTSPRSISSIDMVPISLDDHASSNEVFSSNVPFAVSLPSLPLPSLPSLPSLASLASLASMASYPLVDVDVVDADLSNDGDASENGILHGAYGATTFAMSGGHHDTSSINSVARTSRRDYRVNPLTSRANRRSPAVRRRTMKSSSSSSLSRDADDGDDASSVESDCKSPCAAASSSSSSSSSSTTKKGLNISPLAAESTKERTNWGGRIISGIDGDTRSVRVNRTGDGNRYAAGTDITVVISGKPCDTKEERKRASLNNTRLMKFADDIHKCVCNIGAQQHDITVADAALPWWNESFTGSLSSPTSSSLSLMRRLTSREVKKVEGGRGQAATMVDANGLLQILAKKSKKKKDAAACNWLRRHVLPVLLMTDARRALSPSPYSPSCSSSGSFSPSSSSSVGSNDAHVPY